MEALPTPTKLFPFPTGWYVVSTSVDLKPGQVISKTFCGQEIILFRTEKGIPCASAAHCPHLGAHFGFGGSVEGETIRCPFHDFCFDVNGTCVKTGYGTKPPPKALLKTYSLREKNGFILVWFDSNGATPSWEIPDVSNEGWSDIRTTDFSLRSHPQETTENSVDVGHFSIIHGYNEVEALSELSTEGPYLNAKYRFSRAGLIKGERNKINAQMDIHVHGLGYSFVEVEIPKFGLKTRQYVLPMPIDGEKVNLKIGMSIKKIENPGQVNPFLALFPSKLATKLVLDVSFKGYKHDVGQDFKVWENKVYMDSPALAKGDGPVGKYRQWSRQFYNN
jgi:nitrite reductase/ring-hydroxylating ferredoxin subunit